MVNTTPAQSEKVLAALVVQLFDEFDNPQKVQHKVWRPYLPSWLSRPEFASALTGTVKLTRLSAEERVGQSGGYGQSVTNLVICCFVVQLFVSKDQTIAVTLLVRQFLCMYARPPSPQFSAVVSRTMPEMGTRVYLLLRHLMTVQARSTTANFKYVSSPGRFASCLRFRAHKRANGGGGVKNQESASGIPSGTDGLSSAGFGAVGKILPPLAIQ